MLRAFVAATALLACAAAPAWAQADMSEEIVVTGSRLERFEGFQVPQVFMKRRADFAILSLEVTSDTRDHSQRLDELRGALRGLQSRARPGAVTLALVDEDVGIVREFSMAAAEELMRGAGRPDTSAVSIRLRTPIGPNDTLESINERIENFVEGAPKPGRVEMMVGDTELTLVDPQQYRDPLLSRVTADGRNIASMLGTDYGIALAGLERQIAWQRSSELELTLFLPYSMSAVRQ
jgi:hypothetical protein